MLGDAKLELPPLCFSIPLGKEKQRGLNARFGFIQSLKNEIYFLNLFSILESFCSANFRNSSYLDKRTGKTYHSLSF